MISQTSLDAWVNPFVRQKLRGDALILYELYLQFPNGLSDADASMIFDSDYKASERVLPFKWEKGRVSARRKDLIKLGLVLQVNVKKNIHSGVDNKVWAASRFYPVLSTMISMGKAVCSEQHPNTPPSFSVASEQTNNLGGAL